MSFLETKILFRKFLFQLFATPNFIEIPGESSISSIVYDKVINFKIARWKVFGNFSKYIFRSETRNSHGFRKLKKVSLKRK